MTVSEQNAKVFIADIYRGLDNTNSEEEMKKFNELNGDIDSKKVLRWQLFDLSQYYNG